MRCIVHPHRKFPFSRINTQAQTFNDEDDKAFQWRHQAGTDLTPIQQSSKPDV